MILQETYDYLKKNVDLAQEIVDLPTLGQKVRNYSFFSESHGILENASKTSCLLDLESLAPEDRETGKIMNSITMVPDHEIEENKNFRYHVIFPKEYLDSPASKATIVLHGFNERSWAKYLPWGSLLAEKTGRAVILFPIAFHMNRSPEMWNDAHKMRAVSFLRKKLFPKIIHSTLSNVAISVRLSKNPERFFWSGLESYYDVNLLVKKIKEGKHPNIEKGANVNFFTYSIGTLLGEIIMMTDENGHLSDSNFTAFCGGPVFNRLSPVSKFILDSEANLNLYSYMVEHLESHLKSDPSLASYLASKDHPVGVNFRSLLNYRLDRKYREDKFISLSDRFLAVALKQDEVVPPYEVINTLQGVERDVKIPVQVVDLPYPYRHEDPFPQSSPKNQALVDETFRKVFEPICEFLK
jgi:hypothetical protein